MSAPLDFGKEQERQNEDPSDRQILLTVTGKQTDPDGNTQENTAVYRAVCRDCSDGYLFTYLAEDTEVNLFLSRGSAWMQRGPDKSARMVFDPTVSLTQCDYETAYGIIPMEIRTERISVLAGGHPRERTDGSIGGGRSLKARIRYALIMGPSYEIACSVTIKTQQI